MKKFYIAFSIDRTNCFIVATKEAESIETLGPGFVECTEHHPSFALLCDGEKVFWEKLTDPFTLKPLTNPITILARFYELDRMGWTLPEHSKKAFITKHFPIPKETLRTIDYGRLFGLETFQKKPLTVWCEVLESDLEDIEETQIQNDPQKQDDKKYKMLYLIGINEAGDQVLITFRYRQVNNIPILQLVHEHMGMDGKRSIQYSDVHVEHGAKHIRGGVPSPFGFSNSLPIFIFSRDLMELKFIFDDVPMSALIMQDTAIPFVQLISRM